MSKTNLVHDVEVTFQDRSKLDFKGVILELKMEGDRIVLLRWKNAAYRSQGASTTKRLRFIDISKVRSITERCIGERTEFDDEEFCVQAAEK